MQESRMKSVGPVFPKESLKFIPIESSIDKLQHFEQYVASVYSATSRYNLNHSISYSPDNLIGRYEVYPAYGEYPVTYTMRSYGKWFRESQSYQEEYRSQDSDPYGAEDYVILRFEQAVVPRQVYIYETFNPGSVVRIWGSYNATQWKLLWEGPPQICPEEARKFCPKIKQLNCLINEIRLEFNQSHLKYHAAIDAVLLVGFMVRHELHYKVLEQDLLRKSVLVNSGLEIADADDSVEGLDYFSSLPHEVVLKIFDYLDLVSLCRCAQVSKSWYEASRDPILYQNLSLKRYWNQITGESLITCFANRCENLKKIDLSWCGDDDPTFASKFIAFLGTCSQLTHITLSYCDFVNKPVIDKIAEFADLTDLRLRGLKISAFGYDSLIQLTKLITVDFTSTVITQAYLEPLLRNNPNLECLILDLCEELQNIDLVLNVIIKYNPKLTCWSSFKSNRISSRGAMKFGMCRNLKELDLGWSFLLEHPGECLLTIASNCTELRRLIISQWRGLTDQTLLPVIEHCKKLRQLDLMGIHGISADIIELALNSLQELQLLDISYCGFIPSERINRWHEQFPNVTIQRACRHAS